MADQLMHRLFVYGTLRAGEPNHAIFLSNTEREQNGRLEGFQMYALSGYPFIIKDDKASVFIESYLVDDKILARIDLLELFLGPDHPENEYERVQVQLTDGRTGWVYCYADTAEADLRYPVADGDWISYRQENEAGFCS